MSKLDTPSATNGEGSADATELFDAYRKFSRVDWAIFERLQEIFAEGIEDTAHDEYDYSLEIYASKDIAPTPEQVAAVLAMGFAKFWINFPDETEIACGKGYIGQRRKRNYDKWSAGRKKCAPRSETRATDDEDREYATSLADAIENCRITCKHEPSAFDLEQRGYHTLIWALRAYATSPSAIEEPMFDAIQLSEARHYRWHEQPIGILARAILRANGEIE